MFWYESIITYFFNVIMLICSELMMFTFTNILAQRSSTKWALHIMTTSTSCWLTVSVRCIDTIIYLLIIYLLKLISYIDISVVIVWIFTFEFWLLKKSWLSKITEHSVFRHINSDVVSSKKCVLVVT